MRVSSLLLAAPWLTAAHPSRSISPLSSAACEDKRNVKFYSFHAHVTFEDYLGSPSRAAAIQLLEDFGKAFNIPTGPPWQVETPECDDHNSTHGHNPPLCLLYADIAKTNISHGNYGGPDACPFLQAYWAAFVPVEKFQPVVTWLMEHRGNLNVAVHPNSGCEVYDHRDWPLWMGQPQPLDLTCFHYDCPGCNQYDCEARTKETVLAGKADRCGLKRTSKDSLDFTLHDKALFCSESCVHWVRDTLQTWYHECPMNCDFYTMGSPESNECNAHGLSLTKLLDWSSSCNQSSLAYV